MNYTPANRYTVLMTQLPQIVRTDKMCYTLKTFNSVRKEKRITEPSLFTRSVLIY